MLGGREGGGELLEEGERGIRESEERILIRMAAGARGMDERVGGRRAWRAGRAGGWKVHTLAFGDVAAVAAAAAVALRVVGWRCWGNVCATLHGHTVPRIALSPAPALDAISVAPAWRDTGCGFSCRAIDLA